jgi:hypothetical protein
MQKAESGASQVPEGVKERRRERRGNGGIPFF